MDWNTITIVAALVAAAAAVAAAFLGLAVWRLERANAADNQQFKERLRSEEHYFKLHLLWQELRIAAVTLQALAPATPDYAPDLQSLPIAQITEALATKDLLTPEAAIRVRVARDDLVELEQIAGAARNAEARRLTGFDQKFPTLLSKTLCSLDEARQAILSQLPS